MDFINKMKKREFIELGLKALTAFMFAFIAIILMEGMIYSITLNAYMKNSSNANTNSTSTVAYCIEDGKNEEGETIFFILYQDETNAVEWSATKTSPKHTENYIKNNIENKLVKEVVWHAPSAFEFTIKPSHYLIMGVFIAGVAGFFVYRFIKLNSSYNDVIKTYKETGTIEITNV